MHTLGLLLCVCYALGETPQNASIAAERPNVIVLLADDMGWSDPACFGGTAVETPHLDALAANGVRMTQFYAASAVCSPTRASLLTGRYPLRFDIKRHFSDGSEHLPPGVATLPRLLQDAGYVTGHVGKWHLGGLTMDNRKRRRADIPGPRQHGFDHYQSQIEQNPMRARMIKQQTLYRQGGTCLIRDDEVVPESDPCFNQHLTDIDGDYAVKLIRQFHATGRPFFLNVWWLVPHQPYEPSPEPHWTATAAPGISESQHGSAPWSGISTQRSARSSRRCTS